MATLKGAGNVSIGWKLAVAGLVLVAVAGALTLKQTAEAGPIPSSEVPFDPSAPVPVEPVPESYESSEDGVPRLVALGAGECIPCRAMAPIRAELRREYAGRLEGYGSKDAILATLGDLAIDPRRLTASRVASSMD
ncbi:MAG: hypothetical protein ACN0LA_06330 [Candidatus Longimicrobiales bacterium M2_2A_002]